MTPTAAVRSILGDYVSEARCREVVVAVLRACREPADALCVAGKFAANVDAGMDEYANSTMVAHAFTAMIDALIEEVTAEAGR